MTLKMSILPKFPAQVAEGPGISVDKSAGIWTFGLDYPDLAIFTSIAAPDLTYIAALKNDGSYGRFPVTSLVAPVGSVVQSVVGTYVANADLTTVLPLDDTIPQNTEGVQIISVSITPRTASNKLRARFQAFGGMAAAGHICCALFRNAIAGAICASAERVDAVSFANPIELEWEYTPGVITAETLVIRVGPGAAGTVRLNGFSSGRLFGGVAAATLVVEEIQV
jgi:hypothetical protein